MDYAKIQGKIKKIFEHQIKPLKKHFGTLSLFIQERIRKSASLPNSVHRILCSLNTSLGWKKKFEQIKSRYKPKNTFFLSLYKDKYCLVRKQSSQIFIEKMGNNVKRLDILESKPAEIISSLSSEEVILRNLGLKLKSKREIRTALPFQVESLLPYPLEELILLPELDIQKKETQISLLATSQKTLAKHLEECGEKDWDPDIVSCVPLALFRYANLYFPDREALFLQHESTFIVIEKKRLQAFQTTRGDEMRTLAFMQKKYPQVPPELIKEGENWEFAIPIGLALDAAKKDARSSNFRQNGNRSQNAQIKRKKLTIQFLSACGCFILLTIGMGQIHLKKKEKAALEILGSSSKRGLKATVHQLEEALYKQKKSSLPISPLPKISEILTWLSTHPKLQTEANITRLRYQLIKSPRLGTQIKTYSAKIDLELTSQNPRTARSFHDALLHDATFVDKKNEVRWNADHGIYRISFFVKPRNL